MGRLMRGVLAWALSFVLFGLPAVCQDHPFFDKTNISLFSTEAALRSADAATTRECLGSTGHDLNLPDWIARSNTYMTLYSEGAVGASMGLAYIFHRTGHHRLERLVPIVDIFGLDGEAVVHNFRIVF